MCGEAYAQIGIGLHAPGPEIQMLTYEQTNKTQSDRSMYMHICVYIYDGVHAQIGLGLHAPRPKIQDGRDIIWRK